MPSGHFLAAPQYLRFSLRYLQLELSGYRRRCTRKNQLQPDHFNRRIIGATSQTAHQSPACRKPSVKSPALQEDTMQLISLLAIPKSLLSNLTAFQLLVAGGLFL